MEIMKYHKRVIPGKHMPTTLPITSTLLYVFLLNYYAAPGWLWGVFCTIWAVYWILCLIGFFTQKSDETLLNK